MEKLNNIRYEIERPDAALAQSESSRFPSLVEDHLQTMHASLKTYGKAFSVSLLKGFLLALSGANVSPTEWRLAVGHWLVAESEFPTPSDMIAWIVSRRREVIAEAELKEMAEKIRQQEDSERIDRWLQRLGTPNPTPEQIAEYHRETYGTDLVKEMLRPNEPKES